jgi:hypothetical protein
MTKIDFYLDVDKQEKKMEFLKGFFRNLGLLLIIGLVLFVLFPEIMKQIFQLYGVLLGPIAIIVVIVAALPRKKQGKR